MFVVFGFLGALVLVVEVCSDVIPRMNDSAPIEVESKGLGYKNQSENHDFVDSNNNEETYPFLAAIGFRFKNKSRIVDYTRTVCSSFIIDRRRVLTTCSCFRYPNRSPRQAVPEDYVVSTGFSVDSGEADMWNVNKIDLHPLCGEDDEVRLLRNIGVVEIEQPGFIFDFRTQPVKNLPPPGELEALENIKKMASTSKKCVVLGMSSASPKFVKLNAFLISPDECVNPFCEKRMHCRPSGIVQGLLVRMNGVQVNSTSIATGGPLVCDDTIWGIVDTARLCEKNIFTLGSPAEILDAIGNSATPTPEQKLRLYLGETLAREKLPPAVEEQRLRLLAKLNQMTPPCSPVYPGSYCTPSGYLDMTRAATLPSLTNIGNVEMMTYQAVSEQGTSSTSTVTKSGRLGRRERFLWMGQTRKWWAVLSPSAVLTLYSGPNETRALSTICLETYQARPASQGKSSGVFELFSPGNKTYQFIASDTEDMNSWISAFNDVCSKRRLPSPPSPPPLPIAAELYDTPASHARPVTPTKQEYESMDASFYHVIADCKFRPQEQLYKNISPLDENCYYNLLPRCTTEEIYQTIMEAEKVAPGTGQNRIQAIIKAMEAKVAEAQLYEPVEAGHELER
ncbi:hypothetical protein GE061_014494 [Apolygus lucorum]|uniref:PH domain-containing protein n=1 Tax=Apolygus lucorum TaxID=248454 RepID=A0A8S9XMD4_APOLU|nr:hypothetical protein GE061_014494 [Apolygus lucorum]